MPFWAFQIEARSSPEAVLHSLAANTLKNRWLFRRVGGLDYSGCVGKSSFRILRNITYFNSFNPILFGRVAPTATGSSITVLLTIHPMLWTFLLFVTLLEPGIIAVGLWLLALTGFSFEASGAKQRLSWVIGD